MNEGDKLALCKRCGVRRHDPKKFKMCSSCAFEVKEETALRASIVTKLAAALLSVREVNSWTDEDVARRACGVADALIRKGFKP